MAPKRSGSQQGDATGRKREQLQKQHASDQQARANEISLVSAGPGEVDDTVVDYTRTDQAQAMREAHSATLAPGTRQPGHTDASVDEDGVMVVEGQPFAVQTNDTEVLGRGVESPSPVVGGNPNDELVRRTVDRENPAYNRLLEKEVQEQGVALAKEASVTVRLNTTVANVTVGVGNHYDFEEGRIYRVPRHVADHLEEKGLVWH